IADDAAEARAWQAEYEAKGCRVVKMRPHGGGKPQVDVIISLNPADAKAIFGEQFEPETWLDEDISTIGLRVASELSATTNGRWHQRVVETREIEVIYDVEA